MSSASSKDAHYGSDAVHNFIVTLEGKAKRILKEADKRRREDLLKEHEAKFLRTKSAKDTVKKLSRDGTVLLPSNTDGLSGKLSDQSSKLEKDKLASTQLMHYSVPKMVLSMNADTMDFKGDSGIQLTKSLTGTPTRPLSRSGKSTTLEPLLSSSLNMTVANMETVNLAVTQKLAKTRSRVLDKLSASPFMSGPSANLDEFLAAGKKKEAKGVLASEASWSVKAVKTQASGVLSGKLQSNAKVFTDKQAAKKMSKGKIQEEPQGPTDWSLRGLRCKYRGEAERESLWETYLAANAYATTALSEGGMVLPVGKVQRHPLYVRYFNTLESENITAYTRTRARMHMKRFILDVQEIWLTNLQHLREHSPALLLQEMREMTEAEERETQGLRGRRDVEALEKGQSQVQSVSLKRAMHRSFYTTKMPEPEIYLDFKPSSTATMKTPKPLPPVVENLLEGIDIFVDDQRKLLKGEELSPLTRETMDSQEFLMAQGQRQDAFVFSIDRLLPSAQTLGYDNRRVLWRLSACRKQNVFQKAYAVTEAEVLAFLDDAKSRHNGRTEDTINLVNSIEREEFCVYQAKGITIPWNIMNLTKVRGEVFLRKCSMGAVGESIMARIVTHFSGDFEGHKLELEFSVYELLSLFRQYIVGSVDIESLDWWRSSAVVQIWPRLFDSCFIKEDEFDRNDDPYPLTLLMTWPHTVATNVEEAVVSPKAIAMAYQLKKFVQLIYKPECSTRKQGFKPAKLDIVVVDKDREELAQLYLEEEEEEDSAGQNRVSSAPAKRMTKRERKALRLMKREKKRQLEAALAASPYLKLVDITPGIFIEPTEEDGWGNYGEHQEIRRSVVSGSLSVPAAIHFNRIVKEEFVLDEADDEDGVSVGSRGRGSRAGSMRNKAGGVIGENVHSIVETVQMGSAGVVYSKGETEQSQSVSVVVDGDESVDTLDVGNQEVGNQENPGYAPELVLRSWEALADDMANLSMRVSGAMLSVAQVPGSCEFGKMGIWIKYKKKVIDQISQPPSVANIDMRIDGLADAQLTSGLCDGDELSIVSEHSIDKFPLEDSVAFSAHTTALTEHTEIDFDEYRDRTQVAALFFRNSKLSSTDSVLVNLVLALDTPQIFSCMRAWEDFSQAPLKAPGEPVSSAIPGLVAVPHSLMASPVLSPVAERMAFFANIFSTLPTEGIDHVPLTAPRLPAGFQRHLPFRNKYGFRRKVLVPLLGVDSVLPTIVFGITRTGATANLEAVTGRNIWHSTLAVVEHINRPRTAKDYFYILKNEEHRGPNDPAAFQIQMRGGVFFDLSTTAFEKFKDEYNEIKQRREIFARQLALDSKIENSEVMLRTRDKLYQKQMTKQMQRAIEKKLKKATKSEKGWVRRMKMSTLVEIQGDWERRRDDRTGVFFFHRLIAPLSDAFKESEFKEKERAAKMSKGPKYVGNNAALDDDDDSLASIKSSDVDKNPFKALMREPSGKYRNIYTKEEQFLLTCQWAIPETWDGDPLADIGHTMRAVPSANDPAYGGGATLGPMQKGPGGNASVISLSGDSQSSFLPNDAFGNDIRKILAPRSDGAFQEPRDDWVPPGDFADPGLGKTPGIKTSEVISRPRKQQDRADLMTTYKEGPGAEIGPGSEDGNSSVRGEKSLVFSGGGAWNDDGSIDTQNIEHIAEQLVKSDELIRVLAKRLGIPTTQLVPTDELSSVFSAGEVAPVAPLVADGIGGLRPMKNGEAMIAPRDIDEENDEPEFDSDDDLWSDDEQEAGDYDEDEVGDLPQDNKELNDLRKAGLKESKKGASTNVKVPDHIPFLNIAAHGVSADPDAIVGGAAPVDIASLGWRRLPRPDIHPTFFQKAALTRTLGPDKEAVNLPNNTVFLLPISPVDACEYIPQNFECSVESIFIPNAKKDMERALATLDRNIRREEELSRNLPTDDLLLFGAAKELTSIDLFVARQATQDQNAFTDPREAAIAAAVTAAKSSNISAMEDALEVDIDINVGDNKGNTLFILATQQGSKRMCKFLLRRGANINAQNMSGNTALHYCYTYSHTELAEYLKSRGADDSLVNIDGMTCYEGLNEGQLDHQDGLELGLPDEDSVF